MKIFYITSKPPFPVIDGGCFASSQFLKLLLKAGHGVDHLTIGTQKHPYDLSNYPAEIRNSVKITGVNINTKLSAFDAFIHLFKKGSYNVDRFSKKEVENSITNYFSKNEPDLIIMDSLYTTSYINVIKENSSAQLCLRAHNVECDIWKDLAESTPNLLRRSYLTKLAKDLKIYEVKTLNELDNIFCISNTDIKRFTELNVSTPLHYIPVTLEVSDQYPDYANTDLLHIGSVNWEPNRESVNRIVSWLPGLKAVCPEIKLHLIGSGYNGKYEKIDPYSIIEEGFIEDLPERIQKGGILVTYIESGSGVRIKILEMMALGLPIVSNTKGSAGIECDAIKRVNDETSFISAIKELIDNRDTREKIGQLSRQYIAKHHNIELTCEKLNGIIGHA